MSSKSILFGNKSYLEKLVITSDKFFFSGNISRLILPKYLKVDLNTTSLERILFQGQNFDFSQVSILEIHFDNSEVR